MPPPLREFFAPAEGTDGSEPERVCTERRTVRFALARGCYTIDVDSEFEATDGELYFGQDGHSYLGGRPAAAVRRVPERFPAVKGRYVTRAAQTSYRPCSLADWNTAQRLSRVTCTLVSKRPALIFSRGMLRKRQIGVVPTT